MAAWKDIKISEDDLVDPRKLGKCSREFDLEYLLSVRGTVSSPCVWCNAPITCPGRTMKREDIR